MRVHTQVAGACVLLVQLAACARILGLPDEYSARGAGGGVSSQGGGVSSQGGGGGTSSSGHGGAASSGSDGGTDSGGGDAGSVGSGVAGEILDLAAGEEHVCAIVRSAEGKPRVYCWGNCGSDRIGRTCNDVDPVPAEVVQDTQGTAFEGAVALSAGHESTCALLQDGSVRCWGACEIVGNAKCQGYTSFPIQVLMANGAPLGGIQRIDGAGSHHCGADAAGQVYCWGIDELSTTQSFFASAVPRMSPFPGMLSLGLGYQNVCVVDATGAVLCWGMNHDRETVPALSSEVINTATNAGVVLPAKAVTGGQAFSCAIRQADGRAICWGDGNGASPTLIQFDAGTERVLTQISGAYWHSCALTSKASVVCFGSNPSEWYGLSPADLSYQPPFEVPGPNGATLGGMQRVAAGGIFACAASKSEVYCWGDLSYEQSTYHCDPAQDGGIDTSHCTHNARKIDIRLSP